MRGWCWTGVRLIWAWYEYDEWLVLNWCETDMSLIWGCCEVDVRLVWGWTEAEISMMRGWCWAGVMAEPLSSVSFSRDNKWCGRKSDDIGWGTFVHCDRERDGQGQMWIMLWGSWDKSLHCDRERDGQGQMWIMLSGSWDKSLHCSYCLTCFHSSLGDYTLCK